MAPQPSNDDHPASLYQYGSLSSQYDTIPVSVISLLEEAILRCRVRAFPECLFVFESIDRNFRYHPVIAYEQYLAYWAQWRLVDSAKALEGALIWAQESGQDTESYGVCTLLRIALGKAEVFTKGDFTKAREGMREVRRWLRDVPFDRYTDVQVSMSPCSFYKPRMRLSIN